MSEFSDREINKLIDESLAAKPLSIPRPKFRISERVTFNNLAKPVAASNPEDYSVAIVDDANYNFRTKTWYYNVWVSLTHYVREVEERLLVTCE